MTRARLVLLLALAGCGSPAAPPDAALDGSDAGPTDAGSDAASASDTGVVECDRDHDGYLRDTPECPGGPGALLDCDDDDARTYPGAPIVCRDGHLSRCGRDRELGELAGIAELGVTSQSLTFADGGGDHAAIVAERMAVLGPGAGVSASWSTDGLLLSPISEAILGGPTPALDYPVPWHAAAGTVVRAAAMAAVERMPLVAMMDDTTVRVLEAGLPPVERFADTPAAGRFLSVLSLLAIDGEPVLASATAFSDGSTRVHFGSATTSHESLVSTAPAGVAPWLAGAGHTVLWSWPGSSVVQLVDARTGEVTSWSLGAPALGVGSVATVADMLATGGERIVAVVATSAGIESLVRICEPSGCTSTTSTFVLPSGAPAGPTHVELSETTAWQPDLLVLSVLDEPSGAAHLYLVRTPSTVVGELEGVPSGARDLAVASTDRYGGRLVLVGVRAAGASSVTGLLLCDIE